MASRSYSRSKTSFRSRTESNSSDLFDEMMETSASDDLEPPVPKLMARSDNLVPGKVLKKSKSPSKKSKSSSKNNCKTAVAYDYSCQNSPRHNSVSQKNFKATPTSATPTSRLLTDCSMNSDDVSSSPTRPGADQSASQSDLLKIFDFDEEFSDLSNHVVATKSTPTPPKVLKGQKPVRRVRVGHALRTSSMPTRRSKETSTKRNSEPASSSRSSKLGMSTQNSAIASVGDVLVAKGLPSSSSPSTSLPDQFPTARVPVRRARKPEIKITNAETQSSTPLVLEPYSRTTEDISGDPYALHSTSAEKTASDFGSKLAEKTVGSKLGKRTRIHTDTKLSPNLSPQKPKDYGTKSRTRAESDSKPGMESPRKTDYSNLKRKRTDGGCSLGSSPVKAGTPPMGILQNADSEPDDMLHKIDALLEYRNESGRDLGGVVLNSGGGSSNVRDTKPMLRKSSSAILSQSVGFSDRTYLRRPTNLPAEPLAGRVPRVTKSSSWSQGVSRSGMGGGVKKDKNLVTVVQNVREAHQCMEIGENWQFFEEVHYLMDNIKPSQPLHVRCLGTCNLASHYLDSEFSRQLRAHSYTSRVTALLKDALEHPALCLSVAALFYVVTRDKLNTEWDSTGTKLLVGMLESPDTSGLELTGKAAREMIKIRIKVRSILEKVADQTSQGVDTPPPEDEDDSELPLSQPLPKKEDEKEGGAKESEKRVFRVNTEDICVEELARECIISLTSPQNSPQWLRDELRIQGALDRLANMVMASCMELSEVDCSGLGHGSCDYTTSIIRRAQILQRQLKSIENLTLMNKNNQSYLVVFDGSILLTRLTQFLRTCHRLLLHKMLRLATQSSLLAVLKVLMNLTHESELGSNRVGEQRDLMDNIFRVILQLPEDVPPGDRFDITVLALGLLINLTEHSASNCKLIESLHVNHVSRRPEVAKQPGSSSSQGSCDHSDDVMSDLEHWHNSSIRALVDLFLYHHQKADSASIQVPTPQRLSQLDGGGASSSATVASELKMGVASCKDRFSGKLRTQHRPSVPFSGEGHSSLVGGVTTPEGEEEYEQVELDPLVFDREEFNSALDQAGRHMEDSMLSCYVALLLGILAEHNHDNVDFVRNLMPSKSFTEMMSVLKEIVSFMNITGSVTGLDSIKHTIKYLEAV